MDSRGRLSYISPARATVLHFMLRCVREEMIVGMKRLILLFKLRGDRKNLWQTL